MPTIVDELIVLLKLDPKREFPKDQQAARESFKKTKEDVRSHAKDIEASGKRMAQSFSQVKREAIGLVATLLGAQGFKNFIFNTIDTNAAISRLSRNFSMTTREISGWQGAVKQTGGTAQDATQSIQALVSAQQELLLTGNSSLVPYFNLLGITLKDLEKPSEALLKMADQFSKMDPRRAQALGAGMGLSPAMVNLLMQGREAVNKKIRESAQVTEAQAKAAERAQERNRRLQEQYTQLGNRIMDDLYPVLEKLVNVLDRFVRWGEQHPKVIEAGLLLIAGAMAAISVSAVAAIAGMGGMAAEAAIAAAPFIALAAAMAAVAKAGADLGGKAGDWVYRRNHGGMDAAGWRHSMGLDITTADIAARLGGRAPTASATPTPANDDIEAFFRGQGWSAEQARGIAAGIWAESRGDPRAKNPNSSAYGIGQWLTPRQQDFRKWSGHDIHGSSLQDQLRFMQWEFDNTEKRANRALRRTTNSRDALSAYVTRFMRPAPGAETEGDISRGARYLGGSVSSARTAARTVNVQSTTNVTGPITVNTRATDAEGIARDLGPALRRTNLAQQANEGLF